MADESTEQPHLAETDQDMVIEEGAFLDDWSVAEDLSERDDITDVIRVPDRSRNVDDIHRTAWVDDVVETASSVILELLDSEFAEADDRDIDDETLQDLHDALTASEPPPGSEVTEDISPDTQEIELLEDEAASDGDPFGATGIEFVDVDTGEVLDTPNVPYLETGFHLIDDDSDAMASDSQAIKNLGLKLAALDQKVPLPEPWGHLLAELRDEILVEPDVRMRAAILFIFGQIVRSLGSDDAMTEPLQDLAPVAGAVTRSGLLDRLATQWDDPGDEFFSLLRRLERLDDNDEGSIASVRRASIAAERLLDGDIDDDVRDQLRELVLPPETFPSLVARAVDGHAFGNRAGAVEAWERLARYAKGELAPASIAIVAWLLQGTHGFFQVANNLLDEGWNSRPLLLVMQREAVRIGDRLQEARALKRLVGLDVHLGKRLPDEGASRRRLKSETAARLVRLSTLLRGLPQDELRTTEMARMDSYSVMRDAISLHARNPFYLRRLIRAATRRGDLDMAEKALISLASVVEEPNVRAVVWEQLAALIERNGGSSDAVHEYLERSLEAASDCLPALISMGQHLISEEAYDRMLALRGGPGGDDSPEMNLAWRRAELLERTGGDPMEILSLYRDARDDHPSSVHLFFCVERALARLADWRGLRTLYDSASAPESQLATQLQGTGLGVEQYRLAVEVFLEDAYGDLSDAMLRFVERSPTATDEDDTQEFRVDQNVLWRVVAREIESDPGRAMGRLDVLLRVSKGSDTPWRKRALVWYARLQEDGDRAEQARGAYREVFERAEGTFLRRWAVRGLLRTGDAAWVARNMVDDESRDWAQPETVTSQFRHRLAAELMYISANPDEALDILEELDLEEDDVARAEVAERATVQAIRSRRWVRAIPWMMRCYPPENRPALAEIARHLGASFDDAAAALRYVDASSTETPTDPYVILCELELAYRARDWERALRLIEQGLGTIAAGSIDFRAFLLEQAILVAEWGKRSNELSLTFLEDLWGLDPTVGSSPIYAVSAFLRTFTRMGRDEDFAEYTEYVRTNFTPSVAESLLGESRIYDEATTGEEAAQWYAERIETAPQPLQPYYRWMSVVLGWLFGERDRTSVQDLADATAAGDPTHRVGPFLLAIAYRHADMYASCERQLAVLRTPGYSRPVQDWVLVRSLFHLAVTQNQTVDALERLREEEAFTQFGWYTIAEELFGRAVRDEAVVDALEHRSKRSGGARSLQLEIAEIRKDQETIRDLADEGLPEAVAQSEMAVARGEAEPPPQWDIDQRYDEVVASTRSDDPEQARSTVMRYFLDIDEELLGTPWCPLRLVRGDLSRFAFELPQLERLRDRFVEFHSPEMGAEARLLVARQFLRVGRRQDAYGLMPEAMGPQLICVAWSLFNFALDPFTNDEKSNAWALDLWERRRHDCADALEAEIEYEIGRYLEMIGSSKNAIAAFRRALTHSPQFLPAQVAAGRLLIQSEDWRGLASLWEAEMQFTEDVQALAGVAFRLGYLWERRLSDLPDAHVNAEEAYRRVLRVRPNHFPTLHAMLELALRQSNWDGAEQFLARIVESCPDDHLRVSYLCELAAVREYHLEDLAGALEAYRVAFDTDPESVDALFGILRTDHDGADAVRSVKRRLEYGVTQRELRDLGSHLFAATDRHPEADEIIQREIPTHYPWLVSRLIRAAEKGEHDDGAAEALRTYSPDESTKLLLDSFDRALHPRDDDGPADLEEAIRAIGTHPLNEGKLVAAMHYAGRRRDLEALGMLAAVRARRSTSDLLRAAELTWLAASLMLRKEWSDALDIADQLLQQVPDFMPAIKVAKFAADVARDWEAVVRWFERDAAVSRVDDVASADRLYASEVQRQHLGDFRAALEQLRHVLEGEPTHAGAFEKLRDILLTKGKHRELLQAYERRVEHTDDDEERAELLNQMGDIALNHLRDRRAAIGYFGRSLEIKPKQLRRLRLLSELYESEKRWDRAVVCHRAAADLIDDPIFLGRLWRHVGHLYEKRLDQLPKARNAYARALKCDPDSTEVLVALARVCERLEGFEDALALLSKVKMISRDPKVLLDARIGVARLRNKLGSPPAEIIEAIRDVLVHHPGHQPSIDAAKKALTSAGVGAGLEAFFQRITHDTIQLYGVRALVPAFGMALELGHRDRAFCLAAIAEELGAANQSMVDFRLEATMQRRWPSRPIPSEEAGAVLPGGLVAPFVELLRLSRDALFEGLDTLPGAAHLKKGTRLKDPKNKATQLAFALPGLMALKLRDIHLSDGVPGGSVALFDNGVRIVLDRRWTREKDPSDLIVHLGEQLAAWSMGIGPWATLELDTQVSLFIAIVSNYVRGWAHAERSHLPENLVYPRVQRWLERRGQRVAPYAMEISGRFGSAAIRQQFELLDQAQKRMACLLVDDAGRGLAAAGLLEKPEPGDKPDWLFILDSPAATIRRKIGVAYT